MSAKKPPQKTLCSIIWKTMSRFVTISRFLLPSLYQLYLCKRSMLPKIKKNDSVYKLIRHLMKQNFNC